MNKIITEVTPLSEKDCFYLIDRYKDNFNFPIHRHLEYELNFVENCDGAMRVVGDSLEELGHVDLALVGNGIEHAWEQHKCHSTKIREITIQFSRDLFGDTFLGKTAMAPISKMLEQASNGLAFSLPGIMRIYGKLEELTNMQSAFHRMLKFLEILHALAVSGEYRELSSTSFANARSNADSRRVSKVQDYINLHYKEELRLADLAGLVGMTPTAFSRFFKLRTGRSISSYLIDIRLGYATRQLVDTTKSVAEVCYDCGFNNVSNFNRVFKKKKGSSPKTFREVYQRRKVIV